METMRETDLYPIIRKQWNGVCVRIDAPSRPGISDLVLVGVITVFTEVKMAFTVREKLQITAPQHLFIQKVYKSGGHACVLAYVKENRHWYLITADVLEREWPTVRAAMGLDLGTDLQSLVAKIRSTSPVSGRTPEFVYLNGTGIAASDVAPVSEVKGKRGSITSFR